MKRIGKRVDCWVDTENPVNAEKENARDLSCGCSGNENTGAPDCCSPATQGRSVWRNVLFVILIVAAGAVIARGLMEKSNVSAETDAQAVTVDVQTAEVQSSRILTDSTGKSEAAAKTTFYILDGVDPKEQRSVNKAVDNVVSKLSSQGIAVTRVTVESDSEDHARLSKQYSMTTFPGVVIENSGKSAETVIGEITESTLLFGYVKSSQTAKGCAPKAKCGEQTGKSACCPG